MFKTSLINIFDNHFTSVHSRLYMEMDIAIISGLEFNIIALPILVFLETWRGSSVCILSLLLSSGEKKGPMYINYHSKLYRNAASS